MPRSPTPVVIHHSRWRIFAVPVFFLVLALAAWQLFEFGRYRGGYDRQQEAAARAEMADTIASLRAGTDVLEKKVAIIRQAGKVDKQAYLDIKQRLENEQTEMLDLRQEVAFYRAIVNDANLHRGLYVQNLQLQIDERPDRYRYRLILTRYMDSRWQVKGTIKIAVEGVLADKAKTIAGAQLTESQRFRFKYFQEVSGVLKIPAGFRPKYVIVRALPAGKGHAKAVERKFNWHELFMENKG